jgi:hypothetical protein
MQKMYKFWASIGFENENCESKDPKDGFNFFLRIPNFDSVQTLYTLSKIIKWWF